MVPPAILLAVAAAGLIPITPGAPPQDPLAEPIAALLRDHPQGVVHEEIGRSREGRPIHALRLGAAADAASVTPPALLIVAGLDGRHAAGPEIALGIARRLLADHHALLERAAVYVVPLLNPDGAARHALAQGRPSAFGGILLPVDDDRDGRVDEDGPQDRNGDGFITWMRVFDPPPPMRRSHLADPEDPRLSRPADPARGERAEFALLVEGSDADGDGAFSEDPPGGVDLDRNFPHHWSRQEPGSGTYPLSEPEARALVEWLLLHDDVSGALVIGTSDNVLNVPEAGKQDVTGEAPLGLESADLAYHEEVKRLYEERVGRSKASKASRAGALHAWLYAQFGVPAFAVDVSREPQTAAGKPAPAEDPTAGEKPPESSQGDGPPDDAARGEAAAAAKDADAAKPKAEEPNAEEKAGRKQGPKGRERKRPAAEEDDLQWLKHYDATGEGFAPFSPHEHPLLGRVEVGGFIAGHRVDPPPSAWPDLTERHAGFAAALLERLPRIEVAPAQVEPLSAGVYRVRVSVTNEGFLPAISAAGEKVRRLLPVTARIEVSEERILSGARIQRDSGLLGSGGRFDAEWLVLGEPGEAVDVTLRGARLGERRLSMALPVEESR